MSSPGGQPILVVVDDFGLWKFVYNIPSTA